VTEILRMASSYDGWGAVGAAATGSPDA
jgi:hypothetical protein